MMIVRNDGLVNWHPPIQLTSWCNTRKIYHWPNDNHTCELIFRFGKKGDLLVIYFEVLPIVIKFILIYLQCKTISLKALLLPKLSNKHCI